MAALAANPMNKDASTEESADEVSKVSDMHVMNTLSPDFLLKLTCL
jgi:hypothetical protein